MSQTNGKHWNDTRTMIMSLLRIRSASELGTPEDLGALEVFHLIHFIATPVYTDPPQRELALLVRSCFFLRIYTAVQPSRI